MDERNLNKSIGYALAIVLGYHIIGVFIPMLTWGVMGMVAWRIYLEYEKHNK